MRVKSALKCPGCGFDTTVEFKRPHVVEPTNVVFDCGTCGSGVRLQIYRKPSQQGNTGNVWIQPIYLRPSALLVQMKVGEAEHNAKPIE